MKPYQYKYIKHASPGDKSEMQLSIDAENEFQKIEPHGEQDPVTLDNLPIVYRLENHDGYQMQAYTPSGQMMDSSYHESFCRCGNCDKIFSISGDGVFCYHCYTELTDYAF